MPHTTCSGGAASLKSFGYQPYTGTHRSSCVSLCALNRSGTAHESRCVLGWPDVPVKMTKQNGNMRARLSRINIDDLFQKIFSRPHVLYAASGGTGAVLITEPAVVIDRMPSR